MSDFDLDFGVRITGADESIATVGRVARANESAARTTTAAARSSSAAVAGLGQSVQQVGQRTGQAVGALGQMATQLGSLAPAGSAAGSAISQLGGAVGALSGAMGPLGVALGIATVAVAAFNTAVNYEANASRAAEEAARSQAEALRGLATAAREARRELSAQRDIAEGQVGAIGSDDLQQQAEERRQRVLQMERARAERLRGFGLSERGDGSVVRGSAGSLLGERAASLPAGFEQNTETSRAEIARLRAEVTAIEQELIAREQTTADGQRADEAAALVAAGTPTAPTAPRRGGGGARAAAGGGVNTTDAAEREMARRRDVEAELMKAAEERDAAEQMLADKAQERADAEKERLQEGARVREEAAREAIATQRELEQASIEASDAFAASWRGSIDDVVDSWRDANRALRMSGGQMRSQADLLEMSMTSAGNSIADTIGGTMVGAFESALGAWLDGSKSFVEAAEDMVKGVLKALVIESIVQAVTETARGIASIASQDYAGGAAHLAAAAAWAAVGGVAGAAGAAMGGFGGGGGKDAAPSTAVTPSDASAQQQPSQPMVINVYPGGFITQRDVEAGLVDALNSAGREGRRLDPSLMGG